MTDFSGLQALIVRAMAESGECLVRIRERRSEDGLAVPLQLQLQVLEPDHLDTGKTGDLPGGGFVLQGVEFEPWGGGARTGCSRCIRAKWRCSGGRR